MEGWDLEAKEVCGVGGYSTAGEDLNDGVEGDGIV
jgi:hypothetical protein